MIDIMYYLEQNTGFISLIPSSDKTGRIIYTDALKDFRILTFVRKNDFI